GDLSALPLQVPFPTDNPGTIAKINLGRNLFWDPVLSGELDVACATCHHPARGYADGIDLSIGVGGVGFSQNRQVGYTGFVPRNSPTIINTAYNGIDIDGNVDPNSAAMFWDNRAQGLEEQSLLPLHSFIEMRGQAYEEAETMETIVNRLLDIPLYVQQFNDAFGSRTITSDRIAQALAAFERSIIANNSPFDRYMRGEEEALSPQQITGMQTFINVGCIDCHHGPMLSDFDLHILGLRDNPKLQISDPGDGNYAFRTPTLRNLAFTAPYMHNGELPTLQAVLNFYDDNNNNAQNPNVSNNQLDNDFRQLRNINQQQRADIIAFLNALNDDDFDRRVPQEVPSGLHPGGRIE
ncbi:MAG: cytochrome c peroxidase, partial [Bacteroidota bacterium]